MTDENTLEAVQVLINQEHAASSDIFIIKWILPLSFSANYRFEFTFSFLSFQRKEHTSCPVWGKKNSLESESRLQVFPSLNLGSIIRRK